MRAKSNRITESPARTTDRCLALRPCLQMLRLRSHAGWLIRGVATTHRPSVSVELEYSHEPEVILLTSFDTPMSQSRAF
jgi:hypothetical protein